jgi:hypothetical protein
LQRQIDRDFVTEGLDVVPKISQYTNFDPYTEPDGLDTQVWEGQIWVSYFPSIYQGFWFQLKEEQGLVGVEILELEGEYDDIIRWMLRRAETITKFNEAAVELGKSCPFALE